MNELKLWLLDRLKEPSTYKGISLILGAVGVAVAPELVETILTSVLAVIGAIEVARKENVNGAK